MRKMLFHSLVAFTAISASLASCNNEPAAPKNNAPDASGVVSRSAAAEAAATGGYGYAETDLIQNRNHEVKGKVLVYNDYTTLYVEVHCDKPTDEDAKSGKLFVGTYEYFFANCVNKNYELVEGTLPKVTSETVNPAIFKVDLAKLYADFGLEFNTVEPWKNEEITPLFCLKYEGCFADGKLIVNEGPHQGKEDWKTYYNGYTIKFPQPDPKPEYYFRTETGWAYDWDDLTFAGANWADFVAYDSEKGVTYNIYAGRPKDQSSCSPCTVTFAPAVDGKVQVTISGLVEGICPENVGLWMLNPECSETVKVQGYDQAPVEVKNPAPGQFTTYKGGACVFEVPQFNYYAVHLDLAQLLVKEPAPQPEPTPEPTPAE